MRPLLEVALVLITTATVALSARPAAADQVSNLQARATQFSQEILHEQLEIGADQQQNYVAEQRVDRDATKISATSRHVALDEHRLSIERARLRHEALTAYVDYGFSSSASQLFQSQRNALVVAEYEGLVFGDTGVTIDHLHTAQSELVAEQTLLEQQQATDRAEQLQASTTLTDAKDTQGQLASQQSQINAQLATAIAQSQAAEEAQAQARQAAIHAVVVALSVPAVTTTAASSTVPVSSASGATVDPPLPPFLDCVLQAESGGDYSAVSSNGLYLGGFQFLQATWNEAAQLAGLPELVGVAPNAASKADQDTLAVALYNADGEHPWSDSCSS